MTEDNNDDNVVVPKWFTLSLMAAGLSLSLFALDLSIKRSGEVVAKEIESFDRKCMTLWVDFEPLVLKVDDERICTIMHEGKRIPSTNAIFVIGEK